MPNLSIDDIANFNWDFGSNFLLITDKGNYVWSDPDYNGDNTIKPFVGNMKDFCTEGLWLRDKGNHVIREYCGDTVVIVEG